MIARRYEPLFFSLILSGLMSVQEHTPETLRGEFGPKQGSEHQLLGHHLKGFARCRYTFSKVPGAYSHARPIRPEPTYRQSMRPGLPSRRLSCRKTCRLLALT